MSSKTAHSLNNLLNGTSSNAAPSLPEKNDATTANDSRPQREKKLHALKEKVWLNGKRSTASDNNPPKPAKRTKTKKDAEASNVTINKSGSDKTEITTHAISSAKGNRTSTNSCAKKAPVAVVQVVDDEPASKEDAASSDEDDQEYDPKKQFTDSEGESEHEDEDQAFQIDDHELAEERAEIIGRKGKKKGKSGAAAGGPTVNVNDNESDNAFIMPHRQQSVATSTQAGIVVPEVDDGKSEASSTLDLSLLPDESDEELSGNEEKTQKQKNGRDSKYEAERPIMGPTATRVNPGTLTSQSANAATAVSGSQTDPNQGWDAVTHMVYPQGQRTISKRAQSRILQYVLDEAIALTTGLALFKDAFARADDQLTDSTAGVLTACTNLKQPLIKDRCERDKNYAKHLTNYITSRIGHMRGLVKENAKNIVTTTYELSRVPTSERPVFVKALLENLTYIFPFNTPTDLSTRRRNEPYRNPAITAVLHKSFFKGSKALGRRYRDTFSSISPTDPSKEIPMPMLGLAGVAIFAALKEWLTGEQVDDNFVAADFAEEYNQHIRLLKEGITKKDGSGKGKYHVIMAHLYREATARSNVDAKVDSRLPDFDFDGMEE
ncbi:hypothetical protein VKT23_008196 [Stygiomarasmius scandens]|uniref:DUF6532 domain-containing protein n=1 Tax=Marasmiellus scandens TaxID=2682957 RepID=A0ABR1JMW7_9AGAR